MQVRVYNPKTLELTHILTGATSVQWVRRFCDAGDFEIHFAKNTRDLAALCVGNLIGCASHFGIIGYREETASGVQIRGYDLNGLAKQRIVVPPFVYRETPTVMEGYDRIKGTAEAVLRHYVRMHITNPTDEKRKMERVRLGEEKGIGTEMVWQARFDNLKDVLFSVCTYAKIGYSFSFSPADGAVIFEVLEGIDRTVEQTKVPPVLFSKRYKSLMDYTYTEDKLSFLNVNYAGGDGTEEQQLILEVHQGDEAKEPRGTERFEGFSENSGADADALYDIGLSELQAHPFEAVIAAEVRDTKRYRLDWDLGDFVTVQVTAFGETHMENKQITEVHEVYEPCKYSITPVFGSKTKEANL